MAYEVELNAFLHYYPLVKRDSWKYLPETREVKFEFFNGVRSSFVLYDENNPNDSEQTDITY